MPQEILLARWFSSLHGQFIHFLHAFSIGSCCKALDLGSLRLLAISGGDDRLGIILIERELVDFMMILLLQRH